MNAISEAAPSGRSGPKAPRLSDRASRPGEGLGPRRAVVFAGGEPVDPGLRERMAPDALVIAADSGVHSAHALGLTVDLLVGDLDSAAPEAVAAAEAAGTLVERHRPDKDATDLDLALGAALRLGVTEALVVGAGGGRLDHFLANALLLASPAFASMRVEAIIGAARMVAVHDRGELLGAPGSLVTLLALGGPARGVSTRGLRYPLEDEDLEAGSSRGVSNEMGAVRATVSLRSGTLLAVQPFGSLR